MKAWCVVRAEAQQERRVMAHLLRDPRVETFCPEAQERLLDHRGRLYTRRGPAYPGYLFTRFDPEQVVWQAFRRLPGSIGVMTSGDKPAWLPDFVVGAIRSRLVNGVLMLYELESEDSPFKPGDKVRVHANAEYGGLEGLFVEASGDRVAILLSMFNRQQVAHLDASQIAAA